MVTNMDMVDIDTKKQPVFMRGVLIEQLRWLIRLRWFAIVGVFSAGLVCTYVFPIVKSAAAIYAVAVLLLACNLFYLWLTTRHPPRPGPVINAFGMVQVELDLFVLTLRLHYSGGITNPFVFFYIFHVIIAAIILPLRLSFTVTVSAICMFVLLALGMLEWWSGLGLFISNNLIREIDGTISLESEPGKGTTVTIRIPTKPKKNLITSEESSNENQDTVSG